MSVETESFEARCAALMARAAAEREAISKQLEPIRKVDAGLDWLARKKSQLPAVALGAGLGLSALMLVLPGGRSSLVRGGVALFQLAGSVKQLLSRSDRSAGREAS